MKIQDFCDMDKFEQIMKNWASSTGLATVAVGADGKYISGCYNFTEFCIDLTRGSRGRRTSGEGKMRYGGIHSHEGGYRFPQCFRGSRRTGL